MGIIPSLCPKKYDLVLEKKEAERRRVINEWVNISQARFKISELCASRKSITVVETSAWDI